MDKDVPRGKRDSDTVPRRWHCASDLAGSGSPVGRRVRAAARGLSPLGCQQVGFQEWEACPGSHRTLPHSCCLFLASSSCPLSGCFSPPWFPPSHTSVTGFSLRVGFSVDPLLCTCVCVWFKETTPGPILRAGTETWAKISGSGSCGQSYRVVGYKVYR